MRHVELHPLSRPPSTAAPAAAALALFFPTQQSALLCPFHPLLHIDSEALFQRPASLATAGLVSIPVCASALPSAPLPFGKLLFLLLFPVHWYALDAASYRNYLMQTRVDGGLLWLRATSAGSASPCGVSLAAHCSQRSLASCTHISSPTAGSESQASKHGVALDADQGLEALSPGGAHLFQVRTGSGAGSAGLGSPCADFCTLGFPPTTSLALPCLAGPSRTCTCSCRGVGAIAWMHARARGLRCLPLPPRSRLPPATHFPLSHLPASALAATPC